MQLKGWIFIALAELLSACGGGGGGDGGGSAPAAVSAPPAVTGVSKTLVPAGTTFTVSGTSLNLVASWMVGSTSLTVVSASSTAATLQVPNAAINGSLSFEDAAHASFTTPFTLQTFIPVRVTQLSPSAQVIGQPVTMTGSGLDAITSVVTSNALSSDAPGTITAQTSSSLTFIVPIYAQPGPLTLTSPYEGRVSTSQSLGITPRIWFDWLSQQFAGPNLNLTLQGANLDQVSSATVGPAFATLSSQSASSLMLTVPSATRGAIVLNSNNQPSRSAGAVDTVSGSSTTFYGISYGQVLEEEADNPQLRLTPGKPAGVRAFIASSVAGVASPVVTLTAKNGAATLGTLSMSGPSTLPTAVSRYDSSQSFNAVLPASWVKPGLTVQISYTPSAAASALSIDDQPSIGPGTSLSLVLVPIRIGSLTASVPSTPLPVRESLVRSFPYAYADISITTRAVYAASGVTTVATQNDINSVLSQLETIRALEAPKSMYYGFINDAALQATLGGGRIAGVGWVNEPDNPSNTWRLSAVGTDSLAIPGFQDSLGLIWAQWQRTMIHELGHVHSRHHAPCGDPSNPDPNFPYSNGKIGVQPIYSSFYQNDSAFGAVGSPTIFGAPMADIMSYCSGAWFSDYNYYYVQRFAEKYSGAATIPPAAVAAIAVTRVQSAFLVLSGEIGPDGVKFRPALLSPSIIGDANSAFSGYRIIVRTADGREFTQNLSPSFNSEDRDTAHFSVSLQVASRVASVEVQKSGVALLSDTTTEAAASLENPRWEQDSQGLSIQWNSSVEPYLSVFRVTRDGRRSVLALSATGGEFQVPAADIAGAGIEIQLSTHLNARSVQIIAP